MFAIRVVGPSGYEQWAAFDGLVQSSDDATQFQYEDHADFAADQIRKSETGRGRIVDVCDLEADGG